MSFRTVDLSKDKQSNNLCDVDCTARRAVILLGGFDGLHVGHRLLLSRAKEYRLPIGLMTIVGGKCGSLFTMEEREEIFRRAGIDFTFELPFEEIKGISPQEFVALLEEQFAPTAFICGEDFRFGFQAAGTPDDLKQWARAKVETLPLYLRNGVKVSSTAVKEMLATGDVAEAAVMLGEPFFVTATVVSGRKVGRTMGFPTANCVYPSGKFPLAYGVYETRAEVDGKIYKAITNFGGKPTFNDGQVCVETYLEGFNGDLYGKELTVRFVRKLRDIIRFDSVDALKKQLSCDLAAIQGEDCHGN